MTAAKKPKLIPRPTRYPVEQATFFRTLGSPGWKEGLIINLSEGGSCLATEEKIRVGQIVELRIETSPEGQFKEHYVTASVVWARNGQYGLSFLN